MKFMRLMTYGFMLCFITCYLFGCSDEENKEQTLLRPIATMKLEKNSILLEWKNVDDTSEYWVEVYKAKDEEYELYGTYTTEETSYVVKNLEWDERYKVQVKSTRKEIESAYWLAGEISITYPSKLGESRAIDDAVKISWKDGGNVITAFKVFAIDGTEIKKVTDVDYSAGTIIIDELEPETSYKLCAYSGEEQTVSTYEGQVLFSTLPAEDYDLQYGKGMWIDLRKITDPEYFNDDAFWNSLTEGVTIILSGDNRFHFGARKALDKSVTFATGMTLGENAKFLVKNAFTISQDVASLSFKNIDFVGVINDDYNVRPIEEEINKGFSGKQVCNLNNTSSILYEITFTNCSFTSFRSLVRTQNENDGIKNIVFKGCYMNGIGDQGIVTTSNKASLMDEITFEDCTITNIVLLAELRASVNQPALNIKDCTFCYAPLEGSGNQLIRIDKNIVNITINNTVFGAPLSSDNTISVNQPGTQAVRFTGTNGYSANTKNTWKTNFSVVSNNPFTGVLELNVDETSLFRDSASGDFKIIYQFSGATSVGALKWRN